MTAIKTLVIFQIVNIFFLLIVPNYGQKSIYLIESIIKSQGYVSETEHLTTTDGYILALNRIPFKRGETEGKPYRPVVLLMHGLFGAANSFILLGREHSLAYNLADAGFDVWMVNARGTKNSRSHVSLDPDHPEDQLMFFDFSWEEIGLYDLAETVDFILTITGKDSLHYIGHGQGGTAFLALNSMKPEYNSKFFTVHLLAGVGYQKHFENSVLIEQARLTDRYFQMLLKLDIEEAFPPGAGNSGSLLEIPEHCTSNSMLTDMCELLGIREIMTTQYLKALPDTETGGASFKQMAHYGQNIRDKKFRRWDHGSFNTEQYKATHPPDYDLSLVTANITLHYSVADNIVDVRDVLNMAKDMPNAYARKIPRDDFQHADFIVSADVKSLVTTYIIQSVQSSEHNMQEIYESRYFKTEDGEQWYDAWNKE